MGHTERKKSTASRSPQVHTELEKYMREEMVEHYRSVLQAQREEVLADLNRAEKEPKQHPTSLPDEGDQAAKESEMEMELQEINRLRMFLKEIDGALARLEEGEYGYCEACGLEIGVQRLDVRPVATLCVDCKTLEEARARNH